jgi:hypothetical protein
VVTAPANQTNKAGDTISGVSASATDADGDTPTYSATGLPSGLSIDPNSGAITGTIAAQTQGTFNVTISVTDGHNTGTATFTWVVHDVVVTSPGDQTSHENDVINLPVQATDAEGDTLQYSATNLPPGLSIDPSSGVISGTIQSGAASGGPYTVTVIATDTSTITNPNPNSDSTTLMWTIA